VVDETLQVREQRVVATEKIGSAVGQVRERYRLRAVLVGSGTGSAAVWERLASELADLPLLSVDERGTTLEARQRYFAANPPRGLWRLLPLSLRTPPVPYDDYVAILLAERYWQTAGTSEGKRKEERENSPSQP